MSTSVLRASADMARSVAGESPEVATSTPLTESDLAPEIFRQLYVALDLSMDRGPTIGITSAVAGEGRTTIALGLAETLAHDLDTTVLLVDADFDQPSLRSRLGAPVSLGLAGVLRGEVSLPEVASQVSERLFVVTSGSDGADSAKLLRQLSDYDHFRSNSERGIVTILDLPSILNNSYSALAASAVDALVLVVRAGATPAELVREAIARLRIMPHGVVLNGLQPAQPSPLLRRRR